MDKVDVIQRIKDEKIIFVVRCEKEEKLERIIEASIKGGINLIEITMTVPNAIYIIEKLVKRYKGTDVVIGAGTVLDSETAKSVINVGANFIVSPIFNKDILITCDKLNTLAIPGIATPTEAFEAMQYGAKILKLFPSNVFNPNIIKTYRGPFPNINLLPTGGINLDNIKEWIENGAIGVGIGGELMKNFNDENYEEIIKIAKLFKERLK